MPMKRRGGRGAPYWDKPQPSKKAWPERYDPRVLIGPYWNHKQGCRNDYGPRVRLLGRWHSALRASHLQFVARDALRDTQAQRRAAQIRWLKSRIKDRFGWKDPEIPF